MSMRIDAFNLERTIKMPRCYNFWKTREDIEDLIFDDNYHQRI